MLTNEETANLETLIEDLSLDLRNGNIPAAEKLIAELGNFLRNKQPLGWQMLSVFLIDHLTEAQIRTSLLHFLPKVKEIICPLQPDQEASTE